MLDAYIINSIRDAETDRKRVRVVLEIDPPSRREYDHEDCESNDDRGPIVIPLRDDADDEAEETDAA